MFGFSKKKENRDNGRAVRPMAETARRSPWEQAVVLMDQGKAAEALDQFAHTVV